MSDHKHWYDDVATPALLGAARHAYVTAIRARLADGGMDDIPRTGAALIGRIARNGSPRDVGGALRISKQAASQLVDTLVARGYVERRPDDEDRRRMSVELTGRGQAAAQEISEAVDEVDAQLAEHVTPAQLQSARAVLGALCDLGGEA